MERRLPHGWLHLLLDVALGALLASGAGVAWSRYDGVGDTPVAPEIHKVVPQPFAEHGRRLKRVLCQRHFLGHGNDAWRPRPVATEFARSEIGRASWRE